MKISEIDLFPIEHVVPPEKAYGASRAIMSRRQTVLVRLRTDEGIEGWGEALSAPVLVRANFELLRPQFLGTDIHDRDVIFTRMLNRSYHLGLQNPLIASYSGLNVAMLDALGKKYGVPACRLIGGLSKPKLMAYASDGYITRNPQPDLEASLEYIRTLNLPAIKIKVGLGPKVDVERVKAVRRILGDDIILMVDANGNYTFDLAMESMRRIEPYNIHWYEEPLPPQDYRGYALLRQRGMMSVAGGESHHMAFDFLRLLEGGCIDVAQPDVCTVGGLDESRRIADLCRLHNVRVAPHIWGSGLGLATGIQFAASLPPHPHSEFEPVPTFVEYDVGDNRMRDGILKKPLRPNKDGWFEVGEAPGLGIEVDMAAVERMRCA